MYFRRDFRQFDLNTFQLLLQNTGLSQFVSYDVNEMRYRRCGKFLEVLDKVAPLRRCNPRKHTCPFLSKEWLDLIHRRKAAYRKVQATKVQDDTLLQQFRRLRTQVSNLYRCLRNNYFRASC